MKPTDMPPVNARVDADTLEAELEWLAHVIELRLQERQVERRVGGGELRSR